MTAFRKENDHSSLEPRRGRITIVGSFRNGKSTHHRCVPFSAKSFTTSWRAGCKLRYLSDGEVDKPDLCVFVCAAASLHGLCRAWRFAAGQYAISTCRSPGARRSKIQWM